MEILKTVHVKKKASKFEKTNFLIFSLSNLDFFLIHICSFLRMKKNQIQIWIWFFFTEIFFFLRTKHPCEKKNNLKKKLIFFLVFPSERIQKIGEKKIQFFFSQIRIFFFSNMFCFHMDGTIFVSLCKKMAGFHNLFRIG